MVEMVVVALHWHRCLPAPAYNKKEKKTETGTAVANIDRSPAFLMF